MIDRDKLQQIISNLKGTYQSCQHQAKCIEVETGNQDPDVDYSEQQDGLGSMWDCQDFDNWASMEQNILEAVEYLESLIPPASKDYIKKD